MTKLKGRTKAKARKKKKMQSDMSKIAYKKKMVSRILKHNDLNLSKECSAVDFRDDDVKNTISRMKKVLGCTENGVGLAASQIGINDRVIVIRPDARKHEMTAMINPEIISHSDDKKYGIEGCLSYPKTFAPVERYVSVEVKYFDESWTEQTERFNEGDISGIVVQHEIEHLSEGHCQIHEWWEDPKGMQEKLQEIWDKKFKTKTEEASPNEVVESEDFKREKEEAMAEVK